MLASFERFRVHLPQRSSVGFRFFFNLFSLFLSQDPVKVVVYSFDKGIVMVSYCFESILNVKEYHLWNSFYPNLDNG